MKIKNYQILFLALAFPFIGFAQAEVSISEKQVNIDNVSGNAISSIVYRGEEKPILKHWKSLIKSYDGEVKSGSGYLKANNVVISSISDQPIQVYAAVNPLNDESVEFLAIFLNGDQAISSGNDISGYTAASSIVSNFVLNETQESTLEYFEKQEKQLSSLEGQLKDLIRTKEKKEKEIEDCKELIEDNNYDIKKNQKDQAAINLKIELQKKLAKDAENQKNRFE